MKGDCTLFIWSILYQVQQGISAKETIVEILTESQKMNTKSDSKVTSVCLLSQSKNVSFHDFILWNTGWYISPESFLTNPSEVFGGRWCNCVQITLRCEITVSRILLVNFHCIDRENWRYHCEIFLLTIRNDLFQGHDRNRNDFIKMTILSWIGHLSGCRKTPRDWYF